LSILFQDGCRIGIDLVFRGERFSSAGSRREVVLVKRLRIPGIIGGAGPGATSQLYLDIMARCRHAGLDRRPAVLVASMEIDLAVEDRLLREGVGVEAYLPALLTAARSLAAGGADFLAMPCNTLHVLLPEVVSSVSIPVLSILDAVAREVDEVGCRKVGVLSTASTARTGLYERGLRDRGIEVVGIGPDLQEALHAGIRDEVEQRRVDPAASLEGQILAVFRPAGVGAIVAGCTELKSLMAGWTLPIPVIDSLNSLGIHVVKEMLNTV